jgi:hypothetical protein
LSPARNIEFEAPPLVHIRGGASKLRFLGRA